MTKTLKKRQSRPACVARLSQALSNLQLINEHSLIPSMETSSEVLILIKNNCTEFEDASLSHSLWSIHLSRAEGPSAACVCVSKWCLTKESGQTYK